VLPLQRGGRTPEGASLTARRRLKRSLTSAGFCLLAAIAVEPARSLGGLPAAGPQREAGGTAFIMGGGGTAFLARNFDAPAGEGAVFVNKRGLDKEACGADPAGRLRWTSEYGSVTFSPFGREFPIGGMNEAGLAIEAVAGPAGQPGADRRPALNELQWIQYQLDNCRSVKEVLKSDGELRVAKLFLDLHFLVADRKGNAAVVEFLGGRLKSFARGELPAPVLGDLGYEASLGDLRQRIGFGGDRPLAAGPDADDRFARAATALREYAWLGQTPIVDQAFQVLRGVERPDTRWSVVYSPSRRRLFFKTRAHRRYKIVSLDSLDFSCQSPSLMLSVATAASGNLSRSFVAYDDAQNRLLLESAVPRLAGAEALKTGPADEIIRRMAEYPAACRCR